MNWTELNSGFEDARRTLYLQDRIVADMAKLIVGRLRKSNCSINVLTALKKELANWDMHRKEWK